MKLPLVTLVQEFHSLIHSFIHPFRYLSGGLVYEVTPGHPCTGLFIDTFIHFVTCLGEWCMKLPLEVTLVQVYSLVDSFIHSSILLLVQVH